MADFIVNDITPRVQYTAGGGSPTVFSYAFPIFEDTDLNVYLTPVGVEADDTTQLLTYNIDYTVTNSSPPTVGGFITLSVGATAGDVITIVRNQPYNRLDNYVQGGLFLATSVNTDFDKNVFMSQQDKMYDRVLSPHYNVSGQPAYPKDILLPVLDANETWVMNNAGTQITTFNISGSGGGGVVNSVSGTANRITVTPTSGDVVVNISASYVGQASITTVGTISSGTWNGSTVTVPYGGTGLTSATAYAVLCGGTTSTGAFQSVSGLGTAGQVLKSNGAGALPSWQTESGGSGEVLERDIAQVAHGFAVGDIVYLNTTTYTLAIATSAAASEAVGIVSAVADADNFTLCYGGHVTGLSGLTAGEVYFLSASSAGDLTTTPPSTVGQYVKPLLIADTTTSGYFFNMRGNEVTANAGVPAATQAEQETATSTVTYVSPGRQQFHPSSNKVWLYSLLSAGVPQLSASYNVTSITDNGTGDFTVNFTTAFSSANFCATAGYNRDNTTAVGYIPNFYSLTSSSVRVSTTNSAGVAIDPFAFHVKCAGDQ